MTWLDDNNTQLGGNLSRFQLNYVLFFYDAFESHESNADIFDGYEIANTHLMSDYVIMQFRFVLYFCVNMLI